jgi:hypothetical protein
MDGGDLLAIVHSYSALGDHRTGTSVDWATLAWFEGQLSSRGFTIQRFPFEFPRYRWRSTLTVDDTPVEHIPVFYAFVGRCDTTDVRCEVADGYDRGGRSEVLGPAIVAARRDGVGALVVALEHPLGLLVSVNHPPAGPADVPTVLVARTDLERLRRGRARLQLEAVIDGGRSGNVIGRRGPDGCRPLMITTPLSGWFRCAGERGTGIAVLLGVLDRLSRALPVAVVGTSGHELAYVGARYAVKNLDFAPMAIMHIGASVAVTDAHGALVAGATATDGLAGRRRTTEPLRGIGIKLSFDEGRWIGEAGVWRTLDVPMLSLSGAGVHFHTPADVPDAVTSPQTLEAVTAALAAVAVDLQVAAATAPSRERADHGSQ